MWFRKPDQTLTVHPKEFHSATEVLDAMDLMTDMIMHFHLDLIDSGLDNGIIVKGRPRHIAAFQREFDREHVNGLI